MSLKHYSLVELDLRWMELEEQEVLPLAEELEELVCTLLEDNIHSAVCSCKLRSIVE